MIEYAIKGGIAQAQVAHEVSNGNGRIHMNMLWEMADSERILSGVLEKAKGLIHGVTCGAGLPYHLGELASRFGVYYYPIVSSARAFQVLWKRAYSNFREFWAASSMKTRGWPADTTAFPMPKTRPSRRRPMSVWSNCDVCCARSVLTISRLFWPAASGR